MEKFIIRKDPFFEIVLNEDSLIIQNSDYNSNNGIYKFEEIQSVELLNSKTDWFPTILGNILVFLVDILDMIKRMTA